MTAVRAKKSFFHTLHDASARSMEWLATRSKKAETEHYQRCRAHVLARIHETPVGAAPFHHSFIEPFFPPDFYAALRAYMLECKYGDNIQDRNQDNAAFMNKRYNLVESKHMVARQLRALFNDPEVKHALLAKFYIAPSQELSDGLSIHDEFEFVFTTAGRFQNIHVDIPPKFLSFVFYIPEKPVPPFEEERNATVLYDKELTPQYPARFKANSVCIFAPHFYSYHGFASTIDRDVLVMFYIDRERMKKWNAHLQEDGKDPPPFTAIKDTISQKLRDHPLIEYGSGDARIQAEREACRINAPLGRVML